MFDTNVEYTVVRDAATGISYEGEVDMHCTVRHYCSTLSAAVS